MTTLTDVIELIKKDDEQIIKNQEKGNETLEDLNKNFDKFFTNQERQRLDLLEEKRERSRASRAPSSRTAAGGVLAGITGKGGLLSTLTSPKALLSVLGMTALALATKPVIASVKALRNAFDDYAKTTRGLNRIEADRLKELAKAEAKAKKMEADKLKVEERFKRAQLNAAVDQELKNRQAKAEEKARLRQQTEKARVEFEQTQEMRARAREEARNLDRIAREAKAARRIQSTKNQADALNDIRTLIDAEVGRPVSGKLFTPEAPGGLSIGDGVRSSIIQGDVKVTTDLGDGSKLKTPSAIATDTILKKYSADDLARLGMQAVDTPFGTRFKSLDPRLPGFIKSVDVLAQLDKMPPKSAVLKTAGKLAGKGLVVTDVALSTFSGGATATERARAEGREATQSEVQSQAAGEFLALPGYLADLSVMAANFGAGKLGYDPLVDQTEFGPQLADAIAKGFVAADRALGLGQNTQSKAQGDFLIAGQQKIQDTIDQVIENVSNARSPFDGYANLSQQDYLNMANPQNVRGGALMDYSQYMTSPAAPSFQVNSNDNRSTSVTNNNAIIDIDPVIDDHFDRQYIGIKGSGMYGF